MSLPSGDNAINGQEEDAPSSISISRICLDFQRQTDRYRRGLEAFLRKYREVLKLEPAEDLVAAYLERVWPDDLPGSMIAANIAMGEHGRWLIRPPVDGPRAASFAAGRWAPAFQAYRRQARIVIDAFEIAPHVPPRPFEVLVSTQVRVNPTDAWMDAEGFAALDALPRHRQQTEERLAPWREYLEWRHKLVRLNQVAMRYDRFDPTNSGRIRFSVRGRHDLQTVRRRMLRTAVVVAPLSASQSEDQWLPQSEKRPHVVDVGEVIRVESAKGSTPACRDGASNGKGTHLILTVEAQQAADELESLPTEGFVLSSIGGDIKTVNNERRAIDRLRNGQGHNPDLPYYLFDIRNAAEPEAIPNVCSELPIELNDEQIVALNKAFAALGIFLLQGPPGTGKTMLIAALVYLAALRGDRVLVASQTNLAVDNVLSRLPLRPVVRALRIARTDRVEPASQTFLEDKVVTRWFQAIHHHCEERMRRLDATEQRIREATDAFSALRQILRQASEIRVQIPPVEEHRLELVGQCDAHLESHRGLRSQAESLARTIKALNDLVAWTGNEHAATPSIDLLEDTAVGQLLSAIPGKLREAVSGQRWELPWLTHATTSASSGIGAIDLARQAIEAAAVIETPALEAMDLCRGSSSANSSQEAQKLRELQAEKAALMDSEREEDVARIVQVNREIKRLRGDRWAALCRSLKRQLQGLFQGPLPAELDDFLLALEPGDAWTTALGELLDFSKSVGESLGGALATHAIALQEQAEKLVTDAQTRAERCAAEASQVRDRLAEVEAQLEDVDHQLESATARLTELEQRWSQRWSRVCPDLEDDPKAPEMNAAALETRQAAFNAWNEQQAPGMEWQRRWRPILDEWTARLSDPKNADRDQLRSMYVKHANAVGVTCNEAGQRYFYDYPEFEPFDIVIIDEVSKATPPELLMAMLLARIVILVGDHRQLPPLFREQDFSFTEAAAEGELDPGDIERFKRMVVSTFFGELFEAAPESLQHTLLVQYRMHPQIMEVVNQFYDGRLLPGGGEEWLAQQRQHYLAIPDLRGGWLLEPHQHALWIDSTKDQRGRLVVEEQRGSSKANRLEVELIAATLVQLNRALKQRGYGPKRKVTANRSANDAAVHTWLEREMSESAVETRADLLARGQIRLNGSVATGEQVVRTGDQLEIDARKPVGVITFYGAQLHEIRRCLNQIQDKDGDAFAALDVRTNTVDRFQGMERSIVLVSLVRARPNLRVGDFVKQYQRINVALSRAQDLLVIIGSYQTFRKAIIDLPPLTGGPPKKVAVYENIYEIVKRHGGRRYAHQLLH